MRLSLLSIILVCLAASGAEPGAVLTQSSIKAISHTATGSLPLLVPYQWLSASSDQSQAPTFDGNRAFAHVKAQVAFGPRPAGSEALAKTREYLLRELRSYGLNPRLDQFTAQTPRGRTKICNVIAELPGASPNIVMLASHYDTKLFQEFRFVGANDGGSSTGALLELARVLAQQPEKRTATYWFVFFDGEEAFCRDWSECLNGKDNTYGSRHLAESLKGRGELKRIKAMILLDMIGDKDLTIPRDDTSTPWLVEAIWSTARALGYGKQFPDRSSSIGDDDHMPFKRLGVAVVDVIDFEFGDGPQDNRYWHTADDTLDKVSPRSLQIIGEVLLASLPKIEARVK